MPPRSTWRDQRRLPTDLSRLFDIIRTHGYRGYLPLETLGSGDPREKMKVFLGRVRETLDSVAPTRPE